MKVHRKHILAAAIGFFIMQAPGVATAMASWTFNTANCVATIGPAGNCGPDDANFSDGRIYEGTGGGGNVTVTGWANTISDNTRLELGDITHYGGGLGVRNADAPSPAGRGGDAYEGQSPEHAVDNNERFDLVLFDFGDQLVELSQITLGWWTSDADISVLAYTGNLDPMDAGGDDYIGDRVAYWKSETVYDENLTSYGWTVIGNHDVDAPPAGPQAINPDDLASNYWIVSAYNPVFGSDCTPANEYCGSSKKDYFKIETVAGDIRPPDQIPEPAKALLLATALGFTVRLRNRRRR